MAAKETTSQRVSMNKEQRKAIREAISIEEDWLYRAEMEEQGSGKNDARMEYHRCKLAALKEGLND